MDPPRERSWGTKRRGRQRGFLPRQRKGGWFWGGRLGGGGAWRRRQGPSFAGRGGAWTLHEGVVLGAGGGGWPFPLPFPFIVLERGGGGGRGVLSPPKGEEKRAFGGVPRDGFGGPACMTSSGARATDLSFTRTSKIHVPDDGKTMLTGTTRSYALGRPGSSGASKVTVPVFRFASSVSSSSTMWSAMICETP